MSSLLFQEIREKRESTQPVRARTGGSTFKNPTGTSAWKLIDDVGGTEGDATKGDAIVPWADTHSIPYRTLTRTGDGYVTSVVVLENYGFTK